MKHDTHHKKMDNQIPAWLYFSLHDYSGKPLKMNPIKMKIRVIKAIIKRWKERRKLGLKIDWLPNNYDSAGMYGKCPCQECCNASMRTLDK